ncbi:MAG: PID-CTERM protein-sorting domain-containing protein [Bacteroidia bacterium]
MKTINSNINLKSLILSMLFVTTFGLSQTNGQSWLNNLFGDDEEREEYYEEENTSGFFNDMDRPRFESNYKNYNESPGFDYRIENRRNYEFFNNSTQQNYNYNWSEEQNLGRNFNRQNFSFGGGNGTDGNVTIQQNNGNANGVIGFGNTFMDITPKQPPRLRDQKPELTPGNPGDPDVPIDGGILALLAAAGFYGVCRKRKPA